ncbi:hypothetical protein ACQBAU_15300 [Propionibacteriaceae bacterium Y2011]
MTRSRATSRPLVSTVPVSAARQTDTYRRHCGVVITSAHTTVAACNTSAISTNGCTGRTSGAASAAGST